MRLARKHRHTPEFTFIRSELGGSEWAFLEVHGDDKPLPDLSHVGALDWNWRGSFLALPKDLDITSPDFDAGLAHFSAPEPLITFLLQHIVMTRACNDRWDAKELDKVENFMKKFTTRISSRRAKKRIHDIIDGYSVAAICYTFRSDWRKLDSGHNALDYLIDILMPRFRSVLTEAKRFDDFLADSSTAYSQFPFSVMITGRIRFWMYQELCLIREDLKFHSGSPLNVRILSFKRQLLCWQLYWWTLPDDHLR